MLAKPKNYDEVEVQNFDYEKIELGGHKGIIVKAEEYTSPVSGKTSLKVYVDTASDDKQPNYFKNQYDNDTRIDKRWSNGAIKYVSLGEDENQVKMLKSFITCVENSNVNYTYDWSKEVDQLKNKKIGLVFGLEEYTSQDGDTKTSTKLNQFRSIDKVDNVKIPKVKLLDNTYIDYEEYINKNSSNDTINTANNLFEDVVEIADNELPF